ncbi:MAG: D-alanyl-D-alanine carboxypeptidase [Candidatus Pacebacteria bacterium]|nr:D-alanyl-D-alanine carboxypeptidase [Candidatus Paceibacterota bacterium]
MRRALLLPILIAAVLVLMGVATKPRDGVATAYLAAAEPQTRSSQAYLLPIAEPAYAPIRNTAIREPALSAGAALLLDGDTGRLLMSKNSTSRVPIASLTKLVSAVVATELFSPQEVVTIASGSVRVDGIKASLHIGERMSVHDLVVMMLVESSNDAAAALSAYAQERGIDFVVAMNDLAQRLGMEQCTFLDPAGLNDAALCTADNLSKLIRYVMKEQQPLLAITAIKKATIFSSDEAYVHDLVNTNELLGGDEGVYGGKTGFTDGALGCLIALVNLPGNNGTLISIVLGSQSRFSDTSALIGWAQRAFLWQ